MLKGVRHCLFAMTLSTIFVHPRHGQAPTGLHDVHSVRIMALHAIHLALQNRVVLRQREFGVSLQMAAKTVGGIFAGVDDEFASSATDRNVFAARTMARLTTGLARHFGLFKMQPAVRTRRKRASDVGMALVAAFVADEGGTLNFGW
jgi:hypothetical protein